MEKRVEMEKIGMGKREGGRRGKWILLIGGTRPEVIKLAPMIQELHRRGIPHRFCFTGQHKEMVEGLFEFFQIEPDWDLNLISDNPSMPQMLGLLTKKLQKIIENSSPGLILVQGDTVSAMAGAMMGFYNRIPVGHIEAGLRTYNRLSPYPEEVNRRVIAHYTDFHFAPTGRNLHYLHQERIGGEGVVTGNSGIDALFWAVEQVKGGNGVGELPLPSDRELVLVTIHRRENWSHLTDIFTTLRREAEKWKNLHFIFPLHLNPLIRKKAKGILGDIPNFQLVEPLNYPQLVWVLEKARFVITDSGGLQEEAPALGKPVLVVRDTTERSEALEAGYLEMVGGRGEKLGEGIERVMERGGALPPFTGYGRGDSCKKIVDFLIEKGVI